jgi:hypothetical protein
VTSMRPDPPLSALARPFGSGIAASEYHSRPADVSG